jgi:VWFA-related protein
MNSWGILVGICSAAGLGAQGLDLPGKASAPQVHLDVVAKDSHGQAVMDLTRDDFQVFEGSKPQRMLSFRRNEPSVKRVMQAAHDEYSNRTGAPTVPVRVILFDLLNARFEDRGYMLNQLVPALQHVEASDSLYFYILTMNGTLYAVHGLPDAKGVHPPAADAKPWTDDIKALLDDASREVFRLRPIDIDVDMRVRMTYRALESMASLVAAAPGRKSLIWISHGVPISLGPGNQLVYESVDYSPLLQRLTGMLDRAEVAVYTVRQPKSMAPTATSPASASPGAADGPGITMSTEETLDQFAQLTGGHAFMTPDIRGAIALAASDARVSYQIVYEPSLGNWDGKYHKIRVTCTRKGVKLETKQGYYAFANLAAEGDQEKTALETAVASGLNATEIGIYARLSEHDDAPRNVELAIRIDPADITGPLAVGVAGYLKDGRTEMFPVEEVTPKPGEPVVTEKRLMLTDGVEKLRVLVYDRGSGALGSLAIPLRRK